MKRKGAKKEMGEKHVGSRPVGEDTLNDILASIEQKPGRPLEQPKTSADAHGAAANTTTQIEVDEKFREFFTNTVAVIPESALAGGTAPEPEEEGQRPARHGFFDWITSLFRRDEEDPEEDGEPDSEVLLPGRPLPKTDEPTGEIRLEAELPEDDTVQIDLHMMREQPAAAAGDLTGEIRLENADETGDAPRQPEERGSGRIRFGEHVAKPSREKAAASGTTAAPEAWAAKEEENAAPAQAKPTRQIETGQKEAERAGKGGLRFDGIDLAAILAEGAAVERKAGGACGPLPDADVAAPDKPQNEREPLPEQAARPAGADAPVPAVEWPEPLAAVSEPTGEVTLEPMEQEETGAFGEITLEPVEQAVQAGRPDAKTQEFAFAAPEREPSDPELPAAVSEPTGEITLEPMEQEDDAPASMPETTKKAAEAAPEDEVRDRVHTAAIRLFGIEEEDPDEEMPSAESERAEKASASEPGEEPSPEPAVTEYEDPADAEAVTHTLQKTVARLTLRTALAGILAAALLVLGLMAQGVVPPLTVFDPELAPSAFLGVNLILLAAAAAVSYPILADGLLGLVKKPSPDTLPALAAVAAVLQLAVCLLMGSAYDPARVTLFAAAAALLLFADTLGSRMMAAVVRDNFDLVSAGVDHEAAYLLRDKALAQQLTEGMEAEEPVLLLNRPAALVKGFLAQSFSARRSDGTAQKLARILLAAAAAAAVITLVRGGGATNAVTAFAGVLCLGAPLSVTLIAAVPSLLMQRSASRVGAVIPGWYNIAQLGRVDMVQVDAGELFTPACAQLFGIKTFQKERIDLAILYATSILIAGCNTLEGLFRGMIENKTEMLYEVKDLQKKPGLGFTAWCDACRVVLGTRAMMAQEEIPLPALDYEKRYSKDGQHQVLYLAVSGKLYAMFLLGYTGERGVARSLATLRRENIRLLVTADDPTLTAERIEAAYHLEEGFVKVLSASERAALAPATQYLHASEGCMVHLGGFASLVGGLKAAAGADEAERSACTVQTVSVLFSVLLALFLSVTGGLTGISLLAALLYQVAWSALSVAITLTKQY